MSTPVLITACAVAAVAGAATAWLYLFLLRRQVAGMMSGKGIAVLGGFVLRLAVFAAPLAVAMWLDHRVGIAFAVGFIVPRALLIRRLRRGMGV